MRGDRKVALSERQLACIKLTAEGDQADRIGEKLGITYRTARFHLDNARRWAGAKTLAHLVAIAIARGWITVDRKDAA